MEILAERRWIDPYSPYPRRPGSASRPGPRHPPQKMPHSCHASHLASPGFESLGSGSSIIQLCGADDIPW